MNGQSERIGDLNEIFGFEPNMALHLNRLKAKQGFMDLRDLKDQTWS